MREFRTMRRSTRFSALLAAGLASLAAVGCGSGPLASLDPLSPVPEASASAPTSSPPSGELQAWPPEQMPPLAPDGRVPIDLVLGAFSTVIAPLPDIAPIPGLTAENLPGTAVIRWIDEVRNDLTAEQRAGVDSALSELPDPYVKQGIAFAGGPVAGQVVAQVAPCVKFLAGAELPDDVPSELGDTVTAVNNFISDFTAKLGRPSVLKFAVCGRGAVEGLDRVIGRVSDANGGHTGVADHCVIFANQGFISDAMYRFQIAYATFNCFAGTALATRSLADSSSPRAAWYLDGLSAWAAGVVASERYGEAIQMMGRYWMGYLTHAATPLTGRTLDALGFFAQVEQAGHVMWSNVDDVLVARDSASAWSSSLAGVQENASFFPAGFFRDSERGESWDIDGPGITTDVPEIQQLELNAGTTLGVTAAGYGPGFAYVTSATDVVDVKGNDWTRVGDGNVDDSAVTDNWYCTMEGGSCECPAGAEPLVADISPLDSEFAVAVTGGPESAEAFVLGLSIEQFCQQPSNRPTRSPTGFLECDQVVTELELETAIGVDLTLSSKSSQLPDGVDPASGLQWSTCSYELPNGHFMGLEFAYYPDTAAVRSYFDALRAKGQQTGGISDVAGIGDAAFETPGDNVSAIAAIQGPFFFTMTGFDSDLGGSDAIVEEMARRAFDAVN